MVLKKFGALRIALCLVLASLLALSFTGKAQASGLTLYGCPTSNKNFSTITWYETNGCTGTTTTLSAGDSIVLDNSNVTSGAVDITDNTSGSLSLSGITFQGNGGGEYILVASAGDSINLTGNLSFNQTDAAAVNLPITLGASDEITGTATSATFGGSSSIDLSTYNLTIDSSITTLTLPTLTGSGTLTLNNGSESSYAGQDAASSFTGPTVISSGSLTLQSGYWGTGSITVGSGATLVIDTTANTYTLPNDLTLAGNGYLNEGSIQSCLGIDTSCEGNDVDTTLTLSGNVSLTGNTEVANGSYTSGESSPPTYTATFDFTGDVTYGSYDLTAIANSSTIVNEPAHPASSGSSSSSESSALAPDTGTGLGSNNSIYAVIGAVLIAGTMILLAIFTKKHSSSTSKK